MSFMLSGTKKSFKLSVILINVVMLNVVAPFTIDFSCETINMKKSQNFLTEHNFTNKNFKIYINYFYYLTHVHLLVEELTTGLYYKTF
jgi:hypothetical protein